MQEKSVWDMLFEWLENNAFTKIFSESIWLYPAVEIMHIVGFAVLVGAAIMYDLRLLGLSRQMSVTDATQHLTVWARLSLIAVIPSGLILFMVGATTLSVNSAFQIKLVLIASAGINATIFHLFTLKTADTWNKNVSTPVAARIAGFISIILWISIIACGRLIAYV
ncbi:MAG: DUF6644 family protein [Balneolales bacterium]